MRALVTSLILVSVSSFRVCGSEGSGAKGTASAEVAASASVAAAPLANARIGGQVLAVGQHSVELLVHHSGLVEGLVVDANGKLVSEGVVLSVRPGAKAAAKQDIALAFSAPRARFEGHAAPSVELAGGSLQVALSVDGKPAEASLALATVVRGPEFGGTLLVVGDHSAEVVVRSDGEILAFVRDAHGALLNAAAGLELTANLQAGASAQQSVKLSFDSARKCFVGHAKAGVELSPGSIELSLRGPKGVAVGTLERIALRADAAHAGQVVVAGDYSLELVAKGKELSVFAFDAAGKALAKADASVRLQLGGLSGTNLALKWDPASLSYRADLDGGADFRAQPIRLLLDIDGHVFEAGAASFQALANARLDGAATAKVEVPDVKASLSAGAAKLASAEAALKVTPPKVNVTKSVSASAGANTNSGAKAKASAGFSFGLK